MQRGTRHETETDRQTGPAHFAAAKLAVPLPLLLSAPPLLIPHQKSFFAFAVRSFSAASAAALTEGGLRKRDKGV